MTAPHVFFFRGLSTVASDHARFSLLDFGPMYRHFAKAFTQRGVHFHPVLGMGSGSLEEVAARATVSLKAHPLWQQSNTPVHFLGHSAGGLVARLVLKQLGGTQEIDKVISLLTIATPHRGSQLARICLDMPEHYPSSFRFLRAIGYDISRKKRFFEGLTPECVARSLASTEENPSVRSASIVSWSPAQQWCRPLKLAHRLKALKEFQLPSDGVIERDSQPFGKVLGELDVDHFRQAGFFGKTSGFERMCDIAQAYFKEYQA